MKKYLVFALLLVMIAMSACSATTAPASAATTPETVQPSTAAAESAAPATQAPIVQLTAWSTNVRDSGATECNQMDTVIGKLVAQQTGVAFDTHYPKGDVEQAFNLKLASSDWEDVIACGKNNTWVEKLAQAGVIEPVESYFTQPDKYPNLAKLPQEVLNNFKFTDGHTYYFPSGWFEDVNTSFGGWCVSGWYLYPEYLKAVNMTAEDLKTTDGIEKFLQAIKNANLKNADGKAVIPMTSGADLSYRTTILSTFGVSLAANGFDLYDGKLMNYREVPQAKAAFAWMNKLYRMGVMDPELTTQTNDMLTEKLMGKRAAMIADEAWNFWNCVISGKTAATDLTYVPFPKAPGVDKLGIQWTFDPYGDSGIMMTKGCKNKDALALACDWGEVTGQYRHWTVIYGTRGTIWDWSSKGEPYYKIVDPTFNTAFKAGDYKTLNDVLGYQMVTQVSPAGLDENWYNESTQDTLFWIFGMHNFNKTQGYDCIIRPIDKVILSGDGAWAQNSATINDLDKQYAAKLITAKDDSEFDAMWQEYQDKLVSMGKLNDVKAEFEAAYQTQVK